MSTLTTDFEDFKVAHDTTGELAVATQVIINAQRAYDALIEENLADINSQTIAIGLTADNAAAAGGAGTLSAKLRLATSQLDTGNTSLATIITQLSTTGIKVLKPQGAASVNVGAVAVDNTVGGTTIAIARATRRGVLFVNTSTDKTAYVSMGTPTTSSFPLAPGQQLSVTGVGTWKAIMGASDTATVSVLDEYD